MTTFYEINGEQKGVSDSITLTATPTEVISASISSGAAVSGAIDFSLYVGGFVITPAEWTAANVGFKTSDAEDGTYVIACDKTGSPLQISNVTTNAAKAYAIPTELFPAKYIKLWSKNTTAATITDTNQGGARALKIMLK